MRTLISNILFCLLSFSLSAASGPTDPPKPAFSEAAFVNADFDLNTYLSDYVLYPQLARITGTTGTVEASFFVLPDGSIYRIQVDKGIGSGCDEAVIAALKQMPAWQPARMHGRAVGSKIHVSFNFSMY